MLLKAHRQTRMAKSSLISDLVNNGCESIYSGMKNKMKWVSLPPNMKKMREGFQSN